MIQLICKGMYKSSYKHGKDGNNYHKYRPNYPMRMIELILQEVQNKDEYVDVATGTGQLFFQIAPYFINAKATDTSNKSIDIAKQVYSTLQQNTNMNFICASAENTEISLKQLNLFPKNKFDLVSIAQGLHWVNSDLFLKSTVNDLLSKEGILAILSYDENEIEIENETEEISQKSKYFFNSYQQIIQPYQLYDQQKMKQGYSGYNLKEYFSKIFFNFQKVTINIKLQDLIKYLKTRSGYNQFMFKTKRNYDPCNELYENIVKISKNAPQNINVNFSFIFYLSICRN